MRKRLLATVHILLDTEDDDEASDMMTALLTENGMYANNPYVLDWAYTLTRSGKYRYARPIEIPNEDEDVDLADYIAEHGRREEDLEREAEEARTLASEVWSA